jgi:hypothetical protein
MLANAECMRTHGEPNFPDPDFGPRGGIKGAGSVGINVNAPAFIKANEECAKWGCRSPVVADQPDAAQQQLRRALAEREHLGARAGIEELDFCGVADDAVVLADELVQPWGFMQSAAVLVDVEPVVSTGWLSIDQHAEAYVLAGGSRRHHEVKIAGVEVVEDRPVWPVEHDRVVGHRPGFAKRPLVEA